ncbi:TonB-dependent receptor [Echinicola soli]|nr:TonB-dependent receptor [Echinicola soli]
MKLTIILILVAVMNVSASAYSQNTKLALNLHQASIEQVFEAIKDQSDFNFLYRSDLIKEIPTVSINVNKANIEKVLDQVLVPYQFTYDVYDKTIIIRKIEPQEKDETALPQKTSVIDVSGTVTDENGQPIPGATIQVKGTTKGTVTDIEGSYTINAEDGDILIFSFIGYEKQSIEVAHQTVIDVSLVPDMKALEEVVVVGYGTQSKHNIATAIATVTGESMADLPVTNPTQALVGQVSGVQLQQTNGAPGEAPVVRIRGNGSITSGNGPLYVIDGYPTNDANLINAIAPRDIESMDILKDAAAAAIYGSRAGNGVIIVTTKKGKSGKTRFTFDGAIGFENVMQKYELMNAQEFVEMAKEGLTYQGREIPEFLNSPERWANTDWQDVIFRTAPFQNYQLGASGGTDKMRFAVSAAYTDQQGIIENTFMKRYSLRASFDADITNKLRVGVNLQPSFTQRRTQQTTGGNTSTGVDGILAEALTMPPILPVWQENGDYFVITQDPEMKTIFNDELSNPLVKLDANKDYFYTFRQSGNAFLEYTPITGLTMKSTFNLGITAEKEEWYVEPFLARGNGNTGNISTPNLAQIRARRQNTTNTNWYWSNTATYDFDLGNSHHLTALLGFDAARQSDFFVSLEPRTDKDNPVAFVNSNVKNVQGAVLTQGTSQRREYVFDAIFGRVNYNYNNKYLFSASLRRDRSSRFGPENRTGVFPSVSAGWNISDEPFMESLSSLSMLKVRSSYGETGNDQLGGYYPWITTLQREYYVFGTTDAQVVAYRPGGFSNNQLGWEKNRQFDAGIEVGLFKDRVSLVVDFYNRNSNLILNADLPSINGKATSVIQNVGNVRNRGWEFAMNTVNIASEFKWNTAFNISFNRNKIVSLTSGQTQLSNQGVVRNYVGRPMGDLYMYIVEGTFNNAEDVVNYPKLGSQGIGDLRYRDVSGPEGVPDGVINANDQVRAGNYQPDFVYGLTNTFSYKNLDLTILIDGSHGAEVYRSQELALSLSRWLENGSKESMGRWRSESDPGNGRYHRAGTTNLSSNIAPSTRYLENGSFLRVRNVTLGYQLPPVLLDKIQVQQLRLYVTGQNLHTFSKFGGFGNPQGNGAGDNATNNGVESGTYPLARNISFGVNLTF